MWQRLNVWVSWVLAGTLGLSVFLQLFPLVALPLAVVIPTWAWWTGRLQPTATADGRESRSRWGHRLLAIANAAVIAGLFLPFIAGALSNNRGLFAFSIVGAFSLFLAVPLWIAGLWSVYSAADRAVAGTSRAAPDGTHVQAGVSLKNIAMLFLGAIGLAVAVWAVNVATLTTRWREDVQLSDGSTLTVSRSIRHRRLLDDSWATVRVPVEERLSFRDPATGETIVWHGPSRVAARVDRVAGQYWIVGRCTSLLPQRRTAETTWAAYEHTGDAWHRVDAATAPSFTTPNLLLDSYVYNVTAKLRDVSLREKEALNRNSSVRAAYRSIDLFSMQRC
jgi:hypothetical protein